MSSGVPLHLQLTQEAYADLSRTIDFLDGMEQGLGEKFANVLRGEIKSLRTVLAGEIAESANGRTNRITDDEASAFYSRPIYRHPFTTSKPRRRSSSGRYYVYFALTGGLPSSKPDTLTVLRVLFAGSANAFVLDASDTNQ